MRVSLWTAALAVAALACGPLVAADGDILVADFEGDTYGDWEVTGEAFGTGPARGTLPNQMEVSGFEGRGLVNSYTGGDRTQGTLTSPEFNIERPYIAFLVGGGQHPGETCVNLVVGGRVVRSATGPNDRAGGTERLDGYTWDVRDLRGRRARVQIVDASSSGWGHINVDEIVQTSRPVGVVESSVELRVDRRYVCFRMPAGAGPTSLVTVWSDEGRVVGYQGGSSAAAAYWVSLSVAGLRGKTVRVSVAEPSRPGHRISIADTVRLSDKPRGFRKVTDQLYKETYRPQFHFTAQRNWHNDPNGCVFLDGEYHLFFQHNPSGIDWGNMTWGHAVSPDLVHWTQLDHAIYPDELGTIFSGSAVIDWGNTAGFAKPGQHAMVAIYTSAGTPFTQSIAYSTDRGRTWTKYAANPVLGNLTEGNRDPKVIWHEPTRKWVMALYLTESDYALFGSPDLKQWTKLSDISMPGSSECPDFFEMPVDGDAARTKWLFWGANSRYMLGSFDGTTFHPETEILQADFGANTYAAQTWSGIPEADGRRIQIAWMAGGQYPGMPFNQQMSFPCELTLRTTPQGIRLFREPVRELELLRGRVHEWHDTDLATDGDPLATLKGDLFEIQADLEPGPDAEVTFTIRGQTVTYSAAKGTIVALGKEAPVALEDGRLRLQILVDRTSIEVFANSGRVVLSSCFLPDAMDQSLGLSATGRATARSLRVYELKSAWPQA